MCFVEAQFQFVPRAAEDEEEDTSEDLAFEQGAPRSLLCLCALLWSVLCSRSLLIMFHSFYALYDESQKWFVFLQLLKLIQPHATTIANSTTFNQSRTPTLLLSCCILIKLVLASGDLLLVIAKKQAHPDDSEAEDGKSNFKAVAGVFALLKL